MYKAKRRGSARDSKGVRHEWTAGDEVDAPKGDFDNIDSLEWASDKIEKPNSQNRKDEIKAYLDQEGIEYESDMLKDELLDLV